MRDPEELLAPSEEEWDEMVKNFTDEEMLEYFREFHAAFAQDPERYNLTTEDLEELRARASDFEQRVENVKIAERNEAIAAAKVESAADDLLRHAPDNMRLYTPLKRLLKKKGN